MDPRAELGEFLRSRRGRIRPEDAGLPFYGGRRRVPGLRREELAQLAGVSVDYYVRLEQGRLRNVSEGILDAVARALELTDDERAHLVHLARPVRTRRRPPRQQRVRPGLQRLLDAMPDLPAFVLGRRMDILAWNSLAAALITDFGALAPRERNMPRLCFLGEDSRSLYPDWDAVTGETIAYLRMDAGRYPDDPQLAELVGELSVKSADFRRLWAEHAVKDKTFGVKLMNHPLVGELRLPYETLRLPDDPDQVLVVYTAEPDSPSAAALGLLASWGAPVQPQPAPHP